MDFTETAILSLISHIHSASADFLEKKLQKADLPDLSSSHGFILFQLAKHGPLPMSQITKKINRDKSTTTVLVRKLLKYGLVDSKPAVNDSRSKIIFLTEKGRCYNTITSQISETLIQTAYTDFSDIERADLCRLLNKMGKNFNI